MIKDFFISVLLTEDNQSTNRVPSIVTLLSLLQNEREFLFFQGSEFLRSITLLTRHKAVTVSRKWQSHTQRSSRKTGHF